MPWRLLLLIPYAAAAGLTMRWLSGVIAVRFGYPRAYGQRVLASAGVCLLFEPPAKQQ